MRWRISLVVALALFVAASCDQQPVEPLEQVSVSTPTFDFTNGPSDAGPWVTRGESDWISWFDFPPEVTPDGEWWTVLEGIDDVANHVDCGGAGSSTLLSYQNIIKEGRYTANVMRKEAPAFAWHSDDFHGAASICDVMDAPWIAEGTASLVANHNDMTGSIRNNVWGISLNAWLTDVDTGEKYHAHSSVKYRNCIPSDPVCQVLSSTMFIK